MFSNCVYVDYSECSTQMTRGPKLNCMLNLFSYFTPAKNAYPRFRVLGSVLFALRNVLF